jgi:hypothetical protein
MERKIFIYGLYDVKDNIIRYVGKSVDPKRRLRSHLAKKNEKNDYKHCWIKSVLNNKSNIGYTIIEICNDSNWKEKEIYWIKKLRESNKLVNFTDGGDGKQTNHFYMSYIELKKWVNENKPNYVHSISTYAEWVKTFKKPTFLPTHPNSIYKNNGWVNWGEFLGTNRISTSEMVKKYLNYDDCKTWVNENLPNIKTYSEWGKYVKNNKIPDFIPNDPRRVYKKNGWNIYDFFDYDVSVKNKYNTQYNRKFLFLTYNDCKKWIKNENLSYVEFRNLIKEKKLPNFIPTKPNITYKKEFISLIDLFNGKCRKTLNDYLTYDVAKIIVKDFNLKTNKEWRLFTKNNKELLEKLKIPISPESSYKENWGNWYDWLGNIK